MNGSADPDQLPKKPTDLDLHYLQRQDISGFSRTMVNFTLTIVNENDYNSGLLIPSYKHNFYINFTSI